MSGLTGTVIAIAFYVTCGILAYGFTLAHFQRSYPSLAAGDYLKDRRLAMAFGISGPPGLILAVILGNTKYGLLFVNENLKEKKP